MEQARELGWANPSSAHGAGRASRAILERAREQIAAAIGASRADVVLTSGGTEACNLGIRGLATSRPHIVTTDIEHPAVANAISATNARITHLSVVHGRPPSEDEVSRAITDDTALVVIQMVNHETGTILPVANYAEICRVRGVPLFVDATQALGKIPLDVGTLGATAMAFASHKIGGPAGAGALWIARDAGDLNPLIVGGAQERGRRAGTPDVVSAAGFGAACMNLPNRLAAMRDVEVARDRLERALIEIGALRNAPDGERVSTVTNVALRGWRGTTLVAALDLEGLEAASGAACSSGVDAPSPVISAMHRDETWRATSALRLSLGPETSERDVMDAIEILKRVLARRPS
jgi:cysteine desulfurase